MLRCLYRFTLYSVMFLINQQVFVFLFIQSFVHLDQFKDKAGEAVASENVVVHVCKQFVKQMIMRVEKQKNTPATKENLTALSSNNG